MAEDAADRGLESGMEPSAMSLTLVRGLKVLSAFRGAHEVLSNGELARRLAMTRPTISRLTNSLAHAGYLERVKTGSFRLGLGVLELAYPVLASMTFRQRALGPMRGYARLTGGAVSLATIHGPDLIYVQTVRPSEQMPHLPEIGMTGPLPRSAVGRALLSMLDEDELAQTRAAIEAAYPGLWDSRAAEIARGMDECRARGWTVVIGDWRPGHYGAAAPVARLAGGMCLAVNTGVPVHTVSEAEFLADLAPKVHDTAEALRAAFEGL
ncbi:IclR family transcriptional regulator [Albimonas sp. CAU 1670]|uniref:IclR family transcriptional regulator n=1 Tax=Albimonas sp. CAU 1670 TaxID=3032599 RepID=UPI0023DAABEB|nr:IclR family transcriptional regulator [Albimonas sp. CAU 1670]MDF2234113.1 IclR family transcriptional regulator [Albimonas sp. CAU 1670]